jgi:hypothetical protein
MSTLAVSISSSRPPPSPADVHSAPTRESFGGTQTAPAAPPPLNRQRSDPPAAGAGAAAATAQPATRAAPHHRATGSFLICALFHDVDDGPELGRLIAAELLAAFQEQFGPSLAKLGGGTPHINLNEFDAFHGRVAGVLRGLLTPVVTRLAAGRGVEAALLLTDESRVAVCTADGVDGLGLCASLVALAGLAEDGAPPPPPPPPPPPLPLMS